MTKVLFITLDDFSSVDNGRKKYTQYIYNLMSKYFDIDIFYLNQLKSTKTLRDLISIENIYFWRNNFYSTGFTKKLLREKINKVLNKNNYEHIVLDHIATSIVMDIIERIQHPSIIYISHNDESYSAQSYYRNQSFLSKYRYLYYIKYHLIKSIEKNIIRRVSKIISISETDLIRFSINKKIGETLFIPAEYPQDIFTEKKHDSPINILLLGSFKWKIKKNNAESFINNYFYNFLSKNKYKDLTLTIAGNSASTIKIKPTPNIKLIDGYDSAEPILNSANIGLVPELQCGGVKLKTIEYINNGLPIITTPCGIDGLPFQDEKHCLVYNNKNEFSEKLCQLISNPKLREKLVSNARIALKQKYYINNAAEKLKQFMEKDYV